MGLRRLKSPSDWDDCLANNEDRACAKLLRARAVRHYSHEFHPTLSDKLSLVEAVQHKIKTMTDSLYSLETIRTMQREFNRDRAGSGTQLLHESRPATPSVR